MEPDTNQFTNMDDLIKAGIFNCRSTIYRNITAGNFPPFFKIGRRSVWRKSEIDKWMAKQEQGGAA